MIDLSPRFLDGETSQSQKVKLSMTEQSLIIKSDNQTQVLWVYSKIFVKEDWSGSIGGIFGFKDSPDAGLFIHDRKQFDHIQRKLHSRHKATYIVPTQFRYLFLLGLGAIAAGFLLFPLLGHLSSFVTYLIPYKAENKLGDLVLDEISKEFEPCEDKIALESLQKISNRLIPPLKNQKIIPKLSLHESREANAFSLPGGHIAVLSGFLADAKSENEVAAVLAHEMGHMIKRDSLEVFVQSQGMSLIISLISSSGSYGGMAEFVSFMQGMNYSRKKEFAADEFGTQLLIKSGYSPKGLSAFLNRVEEGQKNWAGGATKYLQFLSTHPETKERIDRIEGAHKSGAYRASLSPAEFKRLQRACQG